MNTPRPSNHPVPLARQLIVAGFFLALLMPFVGAKFINTQIAKEQTMVLQWFGPTTGAAVLRRAKAFYAAWALKSNAYDSAMHALDPNGSTAAETAQDAGQPQAATSSNSDDRDARPQWRPTGRVLVVRDSKGRFTNQGGDGYAPENTRSRTGALQVRDSKGQFNRTPATAAAAPGGAKRFSFGHVAGYWIEAVFALAYLAGLRLSALLSWSPMVIPLVIAILVQGGAQRKLKVHAFGGVDAMRYRAGVRLAAWCFALSIGCIWSPGALPPAAVPMFFVLSMIGVALWNANLAKSS